MHPQRSPRNDHSAANQDVMAAIAAAVASEEQAAAAEAIHQRQHQAQSAPQPLPAPPQPRKTQPAQPQAITQPPVIPQPASPAPQPSPPVNPLAVPPPSQSEGPANTIPKPPRFPENLVLIGQPSVTPPPEEPPAIIPPKGRKSGLAIGLSLVATVCLGIGGWFIWHLSTKVPATAQDTPTPIQAIPSPESTPPASNGGLVIPVKSVPAP